MNNATVIRLEGRAKPWRVTWSEDGKRKTRHFATKGQAHGHAREIGIDLALPDLAVSTEERMLVARLRIAAEAAGVSISTIAEAAVELARKRSRHSVEIVEAVKAFLADCERRNLRRATLAHYRGMLRRFAEAHDGPVEALTRDHVAAWICARYRVEESRQTARTPLMVWLRWCGRQGWADVSRWRDPLRWETRREDGGKVGILRPGVARVLIDRLPEKHRFALALACLTGIRPAELARMNWAMIDTRRRVIELPAAAAKIRRGRTLSDLPPAVWRWVEWERMQGRGEGRVMACNYRNWRQIIRDRMAGLGDWPHDATRHSFASYGYHILGPARTVEIMGHVGGYGLFASRYKACARAWTAGLWFGLRPK